MKWLFFLAHPDDEAVAAGGTIRLLANKGEEIVVVLATKGEAGLPAQAGEGQIDRLKEFERSCGILGVAKTEVLNYRDGKINNQQVWGKLTLDFIDLIEKYRPQAVITFDHSGWYFHLDHVGVSIAALRAVQRAKHKVDCLLFTLFHPPGIKIKWSYVYQKKLPITHEVNIRSVVKQKVAAIKAHTSQSMSFLPLMKIGLMSKEYFQLALATKKGKEAIKRYKIFNKI